MKGDWSLQQENVSLSMSKLLFTCAIGLKSTNNISQTYELFSECIEHESVAIRQHTVQYIMNNDALVLSQTGGELIKLFVRRFTTEIDETVLSLVSDVLAKLTKSGYLNIGEDLWISALECASKQYLRYILYNLHIIMYIHELNGTHVFQTRVENIPATIPVFND